MLIVLKQTRHTQKKTQLAAPRSITGVAAVSHVSQYVAERREALSMLQPVF